MGQTQQQRRRARSEVEAPEFGGGEFGRMYDLREQEKARIGEYETALGSQQEALGLAGARARGEAPSLAQAQLQAGAQQNIVNQMGMTAQARGGSLASQQRQAAGQGAAGGMALNQQMGQLRAQEQAQAEQAFAAQANQIAQQQMMREQQAAGALTGAYGQIYQGELQAGLGSRQMDIQQMQAGRQFGTDISGQVVSAVGSAASGMMSDEAVKNISSRKAGSEAVDAVEGLASIRYRYKDKQDGQEGEILGFSANELEKVAPQLIIPTKRGRSVSVPGVASLSLSATSELARRVKNLEAANGR